MNWWLKSRYGLLPLLAPLDLHVLAMLGAVVLAALTWGILQVFHQTINRYHVRWGHFLRILVLAGTAYLLWRAAMVVVLCLHYCVTAVYRRALYLRWLDWLVFLVPVGAFALTVATGMSRYLHVRRGWAMGFLSTFIVLLALLTAVTVLTAHFGGAGGLWVVQLLDDLWPGLGDLVYYVLIH